MSDLQQPSIGRIVHFVLPDGQHRAAIVVAVRAPDPMMPNLRIFLDGPNDACVLGDWRGTVPHDEAGALGTWHWPERA